MHIATRMYQHILKSYENKSLLKRELKYNDDGLMRDLVKIRLAALLHDIGHPPFSHASEELFPYNRKDKKRYSHEDYSAAIIELILKDVIEEHDINRRNYALTAKEIADFIRGTSPIDGGLVWQELLSSHLDADRADYLLRDSYHTGVEYGKYDLNRILVTMTIGFSPEGERALSLAIEEGGEHAAEGLLIARYMMFMQVYFQHTRRAFDWHLEQALKVILQNEQENKRRFFPPPTTLDNLRSYLEWDDWKVLGCLANGGGGNHGDILRNRDHFRCIRTSAEVPTSQELDKIRNIKDVLSRHRIKFFHDQASKSWYKPQSTEIYISTGSSRKLTPLSERSNIVKGLKRVEQHRIYVPHARRDEVNELLNRSSL